MREINHQLILIGRKTDKNNLSKDYLREDVFLSSPWVVTFIAMVVIGAISYTFKNETNADFYFGSLINAIVGSLLVTSCFSVLLVRFLLYEKARLQPDRLKASLVGALVIVALLSLLVAVGVLAPVSLPASYKVFYVIFFILFACSLELFIIQSTLTLFPLFTGLFFILLFLVPFAGFVGREIGGALGYIMGLALSQVVIFFIQWFLLSQQLGASMLMAADYFAYAKKDPGAVLIGVFCACGVFADKLVSLVIGTGDAQFPAFQLTHNYNTASALALVAVIPAFAYFLLAVEKASYRRYRNFYESIQMKKKYKEIAAARAELVFFLLRAATAMLSILIIGVFLCTYFATQIYTLFGLDFEDIPLFRTSLWGNAMYVLFTCVCILLYYMEFSRTVIFLYGVFAFLGLALSSINMIFVHIHPMYIFPAVCFSALLASIMITVRYFRNFIDLHFRRDLLGMSCRTVQPDECRIQLLKKGSQS